MFAANALEIYTDSSQCHVSHNLRGPLLVPTICAVQTLSTVPATLKTSLDPACMTHRHCAQLAPQQSLLPSLQSELQQVNSASEQQAAALQADLAVLQQRIAAAAAELEAAQTRVQQLEQQLQTQQAEAAATEKRMAAQMDQLKMDVSPRISISMPLTSYVWPANSKANVRLPWLCSEVA